MDLQTLERMERVWSNEEERSRKKQHPEGFPALPEVPTGRYTDKTFYDLETEFLWKQTWLFVGVAGEIPKAGDFRKIEIHNASIIVVRGADQAIRAFYNTCQHRGAPLVSDDNGQVKMFACRYHCWTYNLDGSLRFVSDEHDFPGLDRTKKSLRPLRCELLGNLIFVSVKPDIAPLREFLGDILGLMADIPFDNVSLYKLLTYDVDSNWKCLHDAFLEAYHLRYVHPNTVNAAIDQRHTARLMFKNGHNSMVLKNRDASVTGRANVFDSAPPKDGEKEVASHSGMSEVTRVAQRAYHFFPNLTIPVAESVFPMITVWPVAIDKSRLIVHYLKVAPNISFDTPADREAVAGFDIVSREDVANMVGIQRSLASGGISSSPLCFGEQFIYNVHREIDRVIGRSKIPQSLQVEDIKIPLADGPDA